MSNISKSETADAYYKKMTETPVSRLIVTLGIPTTVSMLISGIYNLADTYFVGTLGESPQAATGILFTLQSIIQAIAFMLGHGSGSFVSAALAEKDIKRASKYVSTAFFTGAVIGMLLSVFGILFLSPFMRILGSTETILPYARDYGLCVLVSCPFMICSLILNNNLRYEGKAFYAMIGLTAGGVLNIFGDFFLIRVFPLGVLGAGISTAVSQFVSFIILFFWYSRMAQGTISLRYISRNVKTYLSIIKVGFPSFIRQGLSSVSNGILNNLAKPFGDAAIAALSVVGKYSSFIMCVGLGIGQGFQPVSSFNYQAGKYKRVKRGLVFTTFFAFAAVGILALFGIVFSGQIVRIFQKSPDVVSIGTEAIKYSSAGLIFFPLSVPVNMLYQSIRRPGVSSVLSLMRSGLIFIPVIFIMSHFFLLRGILLSQPLADAATGLISIPFILKFLHTTPDDDCFQSE